MLFLKDKRKTVKCKISETGSIGQKYLFRDISLLKKKKKGEGDIPLNHLASTFICLFQNSGTKLTKEYNRVPDKNLLSHMI